MTLRKFPPFLYLLLFPLLLTTNALNEFPSSITLRAAVLTHAEPFAVFDPETGVYSGLQIELLDAIKTFATQDNISLTIELEEAPLYAYVLMLDRLSDNCNTTENPQPLEECTRYDMLIGDYYTNPERSMGVDFTPPWLRTAVSALKYIFSTLQGDVTTMEEAVRANATIWMALQGRSFPMETITHVIPPTTVSAN
jgi:hypothetical protein